MDRLNLNILPVVGIMTIGVNTFITHGTKTNRIIVANCYLEVTTQLTVDCEISTIKLTSNLTTCTIADAQVNSKVIDVKRFMAANECDEIQDVFCCAHLVVDPGPCLPPRPVQVRLPAFIDKWGTAHVNQYAKIDAVFCKLAD